MKLFYYFFSCLIPVKLIIPLLIFNVFWLTPKSLAAIARGEIDFTFSFEENSHLDIKISGDPNVENNPKKFLQFKKGYGRHEEEIIADISVTELSYQQHYYVSTYAAFPPASKSIASGRFLMLPETIASVENMSNQPVNLVGAISFVFFARAIAFPFDGDSFASVQYAFKSNQVLVSTLNNNELSSTNLFDYADRIVAPPLTEVLINKTINLSTSIPVNTRLDFNILTSQIDAIAATIPEPSSNLALFGLGVLGIHSLYQRNKK